MRHKIIITLIYAICAVSAFAQSAEIVKIEKLKDKASGINFVKVTIPIWNLNLNSYNLSIYDLNIGLHTQIGNKVYFHAAYSKSLVDRLAPDIQENNNYSFSAASIYENSRANSFSLEGTYFFKEIFETKDLQIKLKSSSNGRVTVTKVTKVPGESLTRFGVRLGMTKGITWYGINDTQLTGIDTRGGENLMDFQDKSTMIQYTNLRIGFCRAIQTNLHVNAIDYGYRTNSGFDYLYADLILSLKNKLDDVYGAYLFDSQNNSMYYKRYAIDGTTPKVKYGFAIGARSLPFVGAISYDIEVGRFTGIQKEGNGYLKIGFNLAFGTSEKIKEDQRKEKTTNNAPSRLP